MRPARRWLGLVALTLGHAVGCGDDGAPEPAAEAGGGGGGGGGGGEAGAGGCAPGEWLTEEACAPAGIPAEACGEGFEPDGAGACRALLPAEPCGEGEMALPGETSCREVAPCGEARFGEVPDAGAALHVDAAYAGGDGDGSPERPFPTLTEALDAAGPGAFLALAAGVYHHNRAIKKPVRIAGRCPALVAIEPEAANFALGFLPGSGGSSLRGVTLRGGGGGVYVEGGHVSVRDVWMSGLSGPGVRARAGATEKTEAELENVLVERARDGGVVARGARIVVERSVIRDTRSGGDSFGRGVDAAPADEEGAPGSELVLRRSVVEGSLDTGVLVLGSRAEIEGSVVRGTRPHASSVAPGLYGRGIVIALDAATGVRSEAKVARSVFLGSHDAGILVVSSDVSLEAVLVEGVALRPADGRAAGGIVIQPHGGAEGPVATLRAVAVRGVSTVGVLVAGAHVSAEGLLVEDVLPESSGDFGNGLGVRPGFSLAHASRFELRGGRVSRVRGAGVLLAGSAASLDGLLVEDVAVGENDGRGGFGVSAQGLGPGEAGRTTLTLTRSRIERVVTSGLNLFEADAVAEDLVVRSVSALEDGRYGDGVSVVARASSASLVLRRALVEESARAGLLASGGHASIAESAFLCNAFSLTLDEAHPGSFADEGGNACGCGAEEPCRVVSASLEPPPPLEND